MKLFLASQANLVIDKIVPDLPKKPKDTNLIYIITASNLDLDKSWVEKNKEGFIKANFKINEYDIAGKSRKQLMEELKDVEVIYVEGGETYYLLDQVRKSGFDQVLMELLKKGVIYIGTSAGSIIMGEDIDVARSYDKPSLAPDLKSYQGLGLVDLVIVAHADRKEEEGKLKQTLEDFKNKPFKLLLLRDNQFLKVVDNVYEVIEA